MDRNVIAGMVEDYWRKVIPAMQTGGLAAFADASARFEEQVKQPTIHWFTSGPQNSDCRCSIRTGCLHPTARVALELTLFYK
jgi:hypothetical protein